LSGAAGIQEDTFSRNPVLGKSEDIMDVNSSSNDRAYGSLKISLCSQNPANPEEKIKSPAFSTSHLKKVFCPGLCVNLP
jgi:hypothetical protein